MDDFLCWFRTRERSFGVSLLAAIRRYARAEHISGGRGGGVSCREWRPARSAFERLVASHAPPMRSGRCLLLMLSRAEDCARRLFLIHCSVGNTHPHAALHHFVLVPLFEYRIMSLACQSKLMGGRHFSRHGTVASWYSTSIALKTCGVRLVLDPESEEL